MRKLHSLGLIFIALSAASCSRCCNDYCNTEPCVLQETYIHKYGVAVPPKFWNDSGQDGAVVSTREDGVIVTRSYGCGVLEGETTYTFPHSNQIQKREWYSQGTLIRETLFHFEGTPQCETCYDSPIGATTYSTWYLSGTPKSVEVYQGNLLVSGRYYNINNQMDASVENYSGSRLVRDDYGQLLSTEEVYKGFVSVSTTYHPNGSPREVVPYQNGNIEGVRRTFHPAGEPNTVEEWSNGVKNGTTTIYQHGEKYSEVPYEMGRRNGVEKRYRDGDLLVQEVSWEDDKLHGPSTTYVGDTVRNEWYYYGSPCTQKEYNFRMTHPR